MTQTEAMKKIKDMVVYGYCETSEIRFCESHFNGMCDPSESPWNVIPLLVVFHEWSTKTF